VNTRRIVICLLAVLVMLVAAAATTWAADAADQTAQTPKDRTIPGALIAIAAALAIGLPALGTALAQSRIGAAGCGTIAEKPDTAGTIILLIAIPETMVILGFVVAVVLIFAL
jgi:V/A-type H+/Na+-transporting ATPase subunit K